jgi:hypothetical protein
MDINKITAADKTGYPSWLRTDYTPKEKNNWLDTQISPKWWRLTLPG